MNHHLEFAERDYVRELIGQYLERSDVVQGIAIDYDRFWLAAWRLYSGGMWREAHLSEAELMEFHRYGLSWPGLFPQEGGEFVCYPWGIDTSFSTPLWRKWTAALGVGEEPFVLIVMLRPEFDREAMSYLMEVDTKGLQVRFEPRPPARLYGDPKARARPLVGGVSVSSATGRPGTLGGIVQTAADPRLALTCAHVIAAGEEALQPSPADRRRRSERIGTCSHSSVLCEHTPPLNSYDPTLNQVDAALIELDEGVGSELEVLNAGPLAGIAGKELVHTESSVNVAGKETGHDMLYVGATVLVREFRFGGKRFGYRHLFELKRASRYWGWTGTLKPPIVGGDSGGWVMRPGNEGPEWLGVMVAGDGPCGYALPAEYFVDWIEAELGPGVSVSR